ncbi:MAG: 2-hydroxychromene-2-carboxylate isomerase [Pseudomonadota bacterium]
MNGAIKYFVGGGNQERQNMDSQLFGAYPLNKQIDLYFDFSSPYSYLAVARIDKLVAAHGVKVRLVPVVLGAIFNRLGWQSSPFLAQPRKLAYMWQDVKRQANKYALEFEQPTQFPIGSILPARIATAFSDAPWLHAFCVNVFKSYFALNKDISTTDTIERILKQMDLDTQEILPRASSQETKDRLKLITEQADHLQIFGAPTFIVHDQLFWGDDRLEDAIEFCLGGEK